MIIATRNEIRCQDIRKLISRYSRNTFLLIIHQIWDSLLSVRLVAGGEVVKEARVHLHKGLQHVVHQGNYRLVPMLLAYPKSRVLSLQLTSNKDNVR